MHLSVNINKVATLRNTRSIGIPDVVRAAVLCLDAGAHGITVHPRPDHRHIRPDDVVALAEVMQSYPHAEYNIEGNPFYGYMELVTQVRPTQCTLVPDEPDAVTSNHGWDLAGDTEQLSSVIRQLHDLGCRVSLFMDADSEYIARAAELGADRIELYTEPYCADFASGNRHSGVRSFVDAAERAVAVGLGVNAGHDLNRDNLGFFLDQVPGVLEVSIGHALIADALEFGLPETVRKYLAVIRAAVPDRE